MGHFSKFLYHPIVILVCRFALTYRNIRFLRLTNILSGNELIEFDRKFLWKNMTNIMGMKMIHNLRRNDWQFTIFTQTSLLILYYVDGAYRTQHRERSNVILRNFIRIGTFQKCLSDSYLRPLQLFPTYITRNNVNASSNCLLFSMWLLRGARIFPNANAVYQR